MPHSTTLIGSLPANPFDWRSKSPKLTQAEIDHEVYKADQRDRYSARAKSSNKRSYELRFATPEALENHRANARNYEKRKRDKEAAARAELKRKAERVNRTSHLGYAGKPGLSKAAI